MTRSVTVHQPSAGKNDLGEVIDLPPGTYPVSPHYVSGGDTGAWFTDGPGDETVLVYDSDPSITISETE